MDDFRIERDDASAPFFDAARDGRLLIKRCPACGRLHPPSQDRCGDSDELEWQDAAGTATLITWAVDDGASTSPALADAAGDGEVIGIVELTEGPWMNTAIPGVDPADLRDGMPMQVQFVELGGGEPVPVFVPSP
ncbi:MAG: OB-fold domain-containing protein [Ilumatobacteraceae bacterium]